MPLPNSDWAGPGIALVTGVAGFFASQKFKAGLDAVQASKGKDNTQEIAALAVRTGKLEETSTRTDERLTNIDRRTEDTSKEVRAMARSVDQLIGKLDGNDQRPNRSR